MFVSKAQAQAAEEIDLASMVKKDPAFAAYAKSLEAQAEAAAAEPQTWLHDGLFSEIKTNTPQPH